MAVVVVSRSGRVRKKWGSGYSCGHYRDVCRLCRRFLAMGHDILSFRREALVNDLINFCQCSVGRKNDPRPPTHVLVLEDCLLGHLSRRRRREPPPIHIYGLSYGNTFSITTCFSVSSGRKHPGTPFFFGLSDCDVFICRLSTKKKPLVTKSLLRGWCVI